MAYSSGPGPGHGHGHGQGLPGQAHAPASLSSSSEMDSGNSSSSQNGNWPFSVRYTASPYRQKAGGPCSNKVPSGNSGIYHGHFDPATVTQQQQQAQYHGHMGHNMGQVHNHPLFLPHGHSQGHQGHPLKQATNGGHFHLSHSHPHNPQNHFLDLKQNQEHQQHLIHYRQRQYDHQHYGLPLNLPPEVILQASHATMTKTMQEMDFQRFENLEQQLQQQQHLQQLQQQQQQLSSGGKRIVDPHFRMRYPPQRNLRKAGNTNNNNCNLEQVETLDEGYIEDLKVQPQDPSAFLHHQGNFHRGPLNPSPGEIFPCDPYSYVYDAQTQLIKEDLSVCSASVNSYLHRGQGQAHLIPPEFLPYVKRHPHPQQQQLQGLQLQQQLQLLHQQHNRIKAQMQQDALENEYEEICDVQKYMNIELNCQSNLPDANGNQDVESSCDKVQDKEEGETAAKDGLDGHVKQKSDISFSGLPQGPLPPKHFKSFSTSTDDILAEVVQVREKHDRVLDQLNLEVENLLINSSSLEDKDLTSSSLRESKDNEGAGSYSTLVVTKDGPPFPGGSGNFLGGSNGSLPFRSAHGHHSILSGSSSSASQNFGTISAFGTFGRKSKQGRPSKPSNCDELSNMKMANAKMEAKMQMDDKDRDNNPNISPEEILKKGKYQRSMSLIPNWKIRDHLMRLPFLRSNSHQDKVKKSEGSAVPHSQSVSGGDLTKEGGSINGNINGKFPSKKKSTKGMESSNQLKARASSVDELRSTEEHWYSADSDTEPDSLTGIAPLPPAHSPPAVPPNSNSATGDEKGPNGNGNGSVNVFNVNVNPNLSSLPGEKVYVCAKGQTFPFAQSVGNLYSNCENSNGNGARMDGGNNGTANIGNGFQDSHPTHPKAPKFRRPAAGLGLKDKWRESWSASSSSNSTSKASLHKSVSMEEETNRLLRWFSLRKNSASANLDPSGGGGTAPSHNGHHRHSTLPQLSEEDLKRISFMEDEEGYWPRRTVQPPALPPPPQELSGDQLTRRHIIAAIVHSENSYVAALQRLVNEYKKPLECSHPSILSHSKISSVFHRLPEILQCHSLFRIALAECVRKWDLEEKIGDVFVASFSKALVLDVYSEFINNFGTAMETAKQEARRKSSFAEFLKVKQMTAHDRLSLFGLMVKPVQRFPQFILLLQDLLKHTPKDHHDRMSLQLALTQLESLAAMLNERKRESEQYQAFRETIKSIGGGKFVLLRSIVDDPSRILLRQDLVTQLEFDSYGSSVAKSKTRKLLLLNDMLICTTATGSAAEQNVTLLSNGLSRKDSCDDDATTSSTRRKSEKSVFKWSYPVRDVEVEDISISPTMSRFVHQKSTKGPTTPATTPQEGESSSSMSLTLLEEMQALMHDYEVLSRILSHVASLKTNYEGLSLSSVKDIMLEIQHQIRCRDEQISYFDSSCLTLLLGSGSSSSRDKVVFQMQSPQARAAWIEELRLAQLALDPNNSPAWDIPLESPYPLHKLPLFVKPVPLAKQPHLTVVKCGCFFTHTFVSQTGRSKILDYLWVSSTDGMSSHLTAFRSQQNTLKEVSSMDLVEEKVNDMLFVQGFIWVATESRKIMIYDPADTDKGPITQQILTDAVLKLLFYNNTIFCGLADGHIAVFVQLAFGDVEMKDKFCPEILLQVGNERIVALFGNREYVYAACGSAIVTVNSVTFTVEKSVILTHHNGPISHMACSGVGLWITTRESETVCLYHLESFQHLQDVSIRPSVYRTVRDSFRRSKGVYVSCLIAHKGWLWIGTNLGVVLTIPLPRLEGVPIISTGNANVSYHGFCGPVTFLMPLMKGPLPILQGPSTTSKKTGKPEKKIQEEKTEELQGKLPPKDNHLSKSEDNLHLEIPPEPLTVTPLTIEIDVPDSSKAVMENGSGTGSPLPQGEGDTQGHSPMSPPTSNGVLLRSRKRKDRERNVISSHNNSSSSTSSIENSSPSPTHPGSSSTSANSSGGKNLVVLRKKSSKDSLHSSARNCKTLPRGGSLLPSNLRFSIDSDVYGLYGNLINVRGLEDEGRFVDPLYDALRRSDPELNSLDAKISTMDRRLKMRMSRPRSLDLSNWSVDSKISQSSDDSCVGVNGGKAADLFSMTNLRRTPSDSSPSNTGSGGNAAPSTSNCETDASLAPPNSTASTGGGDKTPASTSRRNKQKPKEKNPASRQERTALVVVGGRGYLNMRAMAQEHFISTTDSETKSCPHLTLWQMKT